MNNETLNEVLIAINCAISNIKSNGSILLAREIYNIANDTITQEEANCFSEALAELIQTSFNAGSRY